MIQSAEIIDNQVQVILTGSIYIEEAKQIQAKIQDFIEQGYKRIAVDLSAVDYIDSSGLGMLVALHKQTLKKGGCMKISGIKGMVREIFRTDPSDQGVWGRISRYESLKIKQGLSPAQESADVTCSPSVVGFIFNLST
jgi:anti-sigma B factor antagonist